MARKVFQNQWSTIEGKSNQEKSHLFWCPKSKVHYYPLLWGIAWIWFIVIYLPLSFHLYISGFTMRSKQSSLWMLIFFCFRKEFVKNLHNQGNQSGQQLIMEATILTSSHHFWMNSPTVIQETIEGEMPAKDWNPSREDSIRNLSKTGSPIPRNQWPFSKVCICLSLYFEENFHLMEDEDGFMRAREHNVRMVCLTKLEVCWRLSISSNPARQFGPTWLWIEVELSRMLSR